jgi:hypothetical protein
LFYRFSQILAGKQGERFHQEISDEDKFCEIALARVGYEEKLGKGKGCDIGYVLAISSCEGVNSVETCTVTALDAITAFAVPTPNYSSQSRRFFQVWPLIRLPF